MSVPAAATLVETKAYLRLEDAGEDATVARLIAVASELGERFTGQAFVVRAAMTTLPGHPEWARLPLTPVAAITGVDAVAADGATTPLPIDGYAVDIDADGDGWVRVIAPGGAPRVRARYQAGMAATAGDLPEPIRQGVIRLAAHLFTHRDAADESAPPAAVAALWRPWRRMRLAGAPLARVWR